MFHLTNREAAWLSRLIQVIGLYMIWSVTHAHIGDAGNITVVCGIMLMCTRLAGQDPMIEIVIDVDVKERDDATRMEVYV